MEALVQESVSNELSQAKSIINHFIRSCSHNMKNPLSSIEGLVMIAEYCTNPMEVNQCLQMIQQSTNNLLEMIHTLEEYTIHQQRQLEYNEIEAEQLVDRVLEEYATEIDQHKISVTTKVSQTHKWVADEYSNYVILKNLICNAIRFANQESPSRKINVKVGVLSDHVKVEVSDNGIGIPEKDQLNLFEPFHRASEQSKGNGLGLFLVKGLIDRLKASISVCSAEHSGTSFQISMPNHLAA